MCEVGVRGMDKGANNARFKRRMSCLSYDVQFGMRHTLLECPRILNGTNHVVTAMDDGCWNVGKLLCASEELLRVV